MFCNSHVGGEKNPIKKTISRTEPDIVVVGFYPHPCASINLQVLRVRTFLVHSQPLQAPLVVHTSNLIVRFYCIETGKENQEAIGKTVTFAMSIVILGVRNLKRM